MILFNRLGNELKKFSKFRPRYKEASDENEVKEGEGWNLGGISLYEPNSFVEFG